MRPPPHVWQGGGYWQPAFIQAYLLPLGHAAWQGYLAQGRGLVLCQVSALATIPVDWTLETVVYTMTYIPQGDLAGYLQAQALDLKELDSLLSLAATYCPEQALLLALGNGAAVHIALLQNLAIAPPDCYRQFCTRRDEFVLTVNPDQSLQ